MSQGWKLVQWALFAVWVAAAAANVARVRAGFLTNHAADLTIPGWLYIVLREQAAEGRKPCLSPWAARSPETTAAMILIGAVLTEVSQYFWPHGIFSGTFDPLDIAAYAVSVAACYLADRTWPLNRPSSSPRRRE